MGCRPLDWQEFRGHWLKLTFTAGTMLDLFMSVWAGCTLTSPSTNMASHEVVNNSQPLGILVGENTPL